MLDPLVLIWVILWTSIGSYGLYLLITDDKRVSDFYVYGKSLDLKKKHGLFWRLFLVPKRYFMHFYVTAVLLFIVSFAIILIYYIPSELNNKLKAILNTTSNSIGNYAKLETADSLKFVTALLFTLILMIIQSTRRLYECLFVSVYSSNSKINIIHYVFGHVFYAAIALSTSSPILFSQTSNRFTLTDIIDNLVTRKRAILFVLFVYASHYQHKCHTILANLRKDKAGQVITEQHYVPSGSLFEFVTCPHYLTEVIIYFVIVLVQEFNSTYWNLVFLLVISTQTINAITEHRWYKRKYKEYPKERKAIYPKLL